MFTVLRHSPRRGVEFGGFEQALRDMHPSADPECKVCLGSGVAVRQKYDATGEWYEEEFVTCRSC